MANEWFLFHDNRNAEAITSTGHVVIQFIAKRLNAYLEKIISKEGEYVIAVDTDSNYLNLEPLVNKFFSKETDQNKIADMLDKISKEKIQPFIHNCFQELAEYLNAFSMEWYMKREVIASTGVFVAKKRYFLNILDKEGVRMAEPKLKVTGLEAVRSSTPEICRKGLKKIYKVILDSDEKNTQKAIKEFRKEFDQAHLVDVCFPRSVNDLEKWKKGNTCAKGTPIAVRGALLFNKVISEIDPHFETIKSGDKIKFVYLKEPNKFKSNVIALPNSLPDFLGLTDQDVDKNTQFDKTFIKPLQNVMDVMGWSPEKRNTLKNFL